MAGITLPPIPANFDERKQRLLEEFSQENPPNWWEKIEPWKAVIGTFSASVVIVLMYATMKIYQRGGTTVYDLDWFWVPTVLILSAVWFFFWSILAPRRATSRPEWRVYDIDNMREYDANKYALDRIAGFVVPLRKKHPESQFKFWKLVVRRKTFGEMAENDLCHILVLTREKLFEELAEPKIIWDDAR